MKSSRRPAATNVLILGLLGLLGACGSDNETSSTGGTSASSATTSESNANDERVERQPRARRAPTTSESSATTSESNATTSESGAEDLAALVNAAKAEGKLTVYSSFPPDQLTDLTEAFEKAYPEIDVSATRLGAELEARVASDREAGAPTADIVHHPVLPWVAEESQKGSFAKLTGPEFQGEGEYDVSAVTCPPRRLRRGLGDSVTFAWNTDLYPKGITDLTDLLDPALAGGKIGVLEPIGPSDGVQHWMYFETTFGKDFVTKLAEQKPRFYVGTVPGSQALAAGEVAASQFAGPAQIEELKAEGAPIEYKFREGTRTGTNVLRVCLC